MLRAQVLDLGHLFLDVQEGCFMYTLYSAASFYSGETDGHYAALARSPHGQGTWLSLDDTAVSVVGDWQAVIGKCARGRMQPSVLFFVRTR